MDATQVQPGLLRCPNEIVSSILHICPSTDLGSVSRVNKRLNNLANTLLYSNVQFRWTKSETPPVTRFLRSIVARPQLAEYTQSLSLVGDASFGSDRYRDAGVPRMEWIEAESTLDTVVAMVAELQLPHGQDWIRELRNGTMDAIVAFLLARLPNLRALLLTANFTEEISWLGAMLRSSIYGSRKVGWLPRFHQLEEVSADFYTNYWTYRDANTPHLLPLFYLPAVKSLDLVLDNPVEFSWPKGPPTLANLTSLTLRHVREPALKDILSATKQLRKLDWEFMHSERQTTRQEFDRLLNPATADLDLIVDSLLPVRDTLVDLTIRAAITRSASLQEPVVEVRGSLARIVEFDKVTRFEVPLPFLAGTLVPNNTFRISERVPRNIQTLAIRSDLNIYYDEFDDPDPDWDDMQLYINLRSWFYKWRSSTPHLRHLVVLKKEREQGLKQALEMLCAEDRVQVSLDFRGPSDTRNVEPFNPPPYDDDLA